MNKAITYIHQRFGILKFVLFSVFLLLFTKTKWELSWWDFQNFLLIFFFLFVMRLYDDLQNIEEDKVKSERIYTDKSFFPYFTVLLTSSILFLSILLFFFQKNIVVAFLIFFAINHIAYQLLKKNASAKLLLPLLKYPLIVVAFNGHTLAAAAIFFAMLAFDLMDNSSTPVTKKISLPIAVAAFILLILSNKTALVVHFILCTIPLVCYLLLRTKKWKQYYYLILLLITQLIVISYEF